MRGIPILFLALGLLACGHSSDDRSQAQAVDSPGSGSAGSGSAGAPLRLKPVEAPFDIKAPPPDATKTASGLTYKKVVANESGAQPRRNDTVLVHYTGWRPSNGETFFTTRGRSEPVALNLSQAAPGFTEGLQLLRKGEKAMLWVPPEIGYKASPTQGQRETLVYEFEVVDIQPAPAIPDNVAKPPDDAQTLRSGTKFVVVRPGTGSEKARSFDNVTFHYTAWDSEGRMIDTTETRKRSVTAQPLKQSTAMSEVLSSMTAGSRVRFWIDAEKMARGGKAVGGVEHGLLCYEVEVLQVAKPLHDPPPPPPDVARPPPGARRTAKGVFYRVIKTGTSNEHPLPTNSVKVNYTGWTTDGQMFDTSTAKGEPVQFSLANVIAGWNDTIPQMTVGDHWLMWIPEELAYKGVAGKPKGMLVFDVDLVAIVPPSSH